MQSPSRWCRSLRGNDAETAPDLSLGAELRLSLPVATQGLVLGEMYFIRHADGSTEVDNIRTDPAGTSNLRSTRAGETIAERSRRLMDGSQKAGLQELNG